jgi:hypothetical protein
MSFIQILLKIEDCEGRVIVYAGSAFIQINRVFQCLIYTQCENLNTYKYTMKSQQYTPNPHFKHIRFKAEW